MPKICTNILPKLPQKKSPKHPKKTKHHIFFLEWAYYYADPGNDPHIPFLKVPLG